MTAVSGKTPSSSSVRAGRHGLQRSVPLLLVGAVLLATATLASSQGDVPPCAWSDGLNLCATNVEYTLRAGEQSPAAALGGMQRAQYQLLYNQTRCMTLLTKESCQLQSREHGCAWKTAGGYWLCVVDSSLYGLATTCPGSPAHTVHQCGLRNTSQACKEDGNCVWKEKFFVEPTKDLAALTTDDAVSRDDLCFIKDVKNFTDYQQYTAWMSRDMDDLADFSEWFGDCDFARNLFQARQYRQMCSNITRVCGDEGCWKPEWQYLETTCRAAGCSWKDLANERGYGYSCQSDLGRYNDLLFGSERGPIRDQLVECMGPEASRSYTTCTNYRPSSEGPSSGGPSSEGPSSEGPSSGGLSSGDSVGVRMLKTRWVLLSVLCALLAVLAGLSG